MMQWKRRFEFGRKIFQSSGAGNSRGEPVWLPCAKISHLFASNSGRVEKGDHWERENVFGTLAHIHDLTFENSLGRERLGESQQGVVFLRVSALGWALSTPFPS